MARLLRRFPHDFFLADCRDPIYINNYFELSQFYMDVASGNLASFTFLEPRWFKYLDYGASDQHPPHDVKLGEFLIAHLYASLRNGPKWNETLFLITYDEHGGFYDHVPTPLDDIPSPDGRTPPSGQPYFTFDRLGVRVPMLMISPWINKGTVVGEPVEQGVNKHYDHTSVAATLKKVWNMPNFLTKRDAWAATFENIVGMRNTPRTDCPESLPIPGSSAEYEKFKKQSLMTMEQVLKESMMAGVNKKHWSLPLSDLQKHVLAIARGLDDEFDREYITMHPNWLDEIGIQNEEEGSLYVQMQIKKWMAKMNTQYGDAV